MRRALVAARVWGSRCWPNPTVGACLVRDDRLLGEGVHRGPGQPHAEPAAIEDARSRGHDPRGATLVVTLEPCNHRGRTPACTAAIVEAQIARVVYANADENPQVTGGGAQFLRQQGVEVVGGPCSELAAELNHPFFETAGGQRPHVTLKLAVDRNGQLARRQGRVESAADRAVTGVLAHRRAHRLRQAASCVVVGRGTAFADHPRLDVRLVRAEHQPRPVVLDTELRSRAFELPGHALLLHGPKAAASERERLSAAGHECCELGAGPGDWPAVLAELDRRNLGIVLVEGGAEVAQSLLRSGLVDRLHLLWADRELGGDGPRLQGLAAWFAAPTPDSPELAGQSWRMLRRRRVGPDWEWVLRPRHD